VPLDARESSLSSHPLFSYIVFFSSLSPPHPFSSSPLLLLLLSSPISVRVLVRVTLLPGGNAVPQAHHQRLRQIHAACRREPCQSRQPRDLVVQHAHRGAQRPGRGDITSLHRAPAPERVLVRAQLRHARRPMCPLSSLSLHSTSLHITPHHSLHFKQIKLRGPRARAWCLIPRVRCMIQRFCSR
jgi:hypothetical protein